MTISMYQASIPPCVRMLENLRVIVEKGAAHAKAKNFDASALINARLAPDMLAFARQVQIAADLAKGCAARLAGVEPPKYEDNEASFPDLIARIDKTLAYLKTFKPEQIDGSEARDVVLKMRTGERHFTGINYLFGFALPNLYFHATTTYALLRHNGVELGKADFIGGT